MLDRAQKESIVKGLKGDFDKAKAVFLTNIIGISSNDSVEIRKNVREANGKVIIARNTLLSRAGAGTPAEGMLKDLKGPHAVAVAYDDAAAVAKCLKNASKDHEIVEFKAGILDGTELSIADLKQLADLPSRDEMLGTLLATFNAPISALARVLYAVQEQKGGSGEEATEQVAAEEPKDETNE